MINKVYIEYLLLKDDEKSFQQVISIIQPKLLSFAQNILKDKSNAQDALQDSLIAIVKGVRRLKNHRKFHAWIYQVTRNKCFDIIRKNHKFKNECDLDSISEPINYENMVEEKNQDNQIDMMSMINQLPHKQKTVIQLFYYDGFSILEISKILDKPAGTIKSQLFDAREKLKHLIGE
jgi:RNA polymerase sigma-70 factor (ECF subfamily)